MYNNNYQNQQYATPNYGPQNYQQPNPYNSVPPYYRPIKGIGYVGYNILYAIPIIGFIMVIVNALSEDNINKRNYARSYLWAMLIGLIISIIVGIIAAIVAVIGAAANQ